MCVSPLTFMANCVLNSREGNVMNSYCLLLTERHRNTSTATIHWERVMKRGASN